VIGVNVPKTPSKGNKITGGISIVTCGFALSVDTQKLRHRGGVGITDGRESATDIGEAVVDPGAVDVESDGFAGVADADDLSLHCPRKVLGSEGSMGGTVVNPLLGTIVPSPKYPAIVPALLMPSSWSKAGSPGLMTF